MFTKDFICLFKRHKGNLLIGKEFRVKVKSLSRVRLFVTPGTAARQASLPNTNSQSLPKPVSIELVMPSNHLIIIHHPLLLLPSIFPSIRVFSNKSAQKVAKVVAFQLQHQSSQ